MELDPVGREGVRTCRSNFPNIPTSYQLFLVDHTAYIKGTVNDPTTYPEPNPAHGSNHWAFERALSVALVPLVAVGFAKHGSSAILDGALALTLVVHSHIGFDCILADYLHKRKFPIAGPLGAWSVRALTLTTLYGLYEFNTSKYPNTK